jgi:hypothetical protein
MSTKSVSTHKFDREIIGSCLNSERKTSQRECVSKIRWHFFKPIEPKKSKLKCLNIQLKHHFVSI